MKRLSQLTAILALMMVAVSTNAQTYLDGDKFRVGMRAGPVMSWLTGDALSKPSPNYGFTAAIYFKHRIGNHLHFQTEVGPSVRGSRFNGNGSNGYNKFTLMYMDAAELLMIDLKKDVHLHTLVLGVQPSALLQSWVYSPYFQLSPAARGVKLNGMDCSAVFGYQLHKKVYGIQSVIKIGLTNINRGLNMYDVLGNPLGPATNNSGIIRNISWETSIAF